MMSRIVALVLLATCCYCLNGARSAGAQQANTPTCRDEDGNPVDWFIAYKFPMIIGQQEPYGSGAGYAYLSGEGQARLAIEDDDSFVDNFRQLLHEHLGVPMEVGNSQDTSEQPGWTVAKYPIDHVNSVIMRSLSPVYCPVRPDSLNWIFYNDHPPKSQDGESQGQSSSRAHAKGALLLDDITGDAMWLSHSAPQFPPPIPDPLIFGENSFRNGQTFICMNFDASKQGAKVVKHMANMFALVYDSHVSRKLRNSIPELDLLKLENEKGGLTSRNRLDKLEQTLTTRGGQQFELYSKSAKLNGDMYASWLADELDSSLYVETWRMGNGDPLDSDCPRDKFQVSNVASMRLISNSKKLFSWPYTKDHSKWAITQTREGGSFCLADINRMASQSKRGGGAICLRDPKVWTVFSNTIEELEPCQYKTRATSKAKLWARLKESVEKIKQLLG